MRALLAIWIVFAISSWSIPLAAQPTDDTDSESDNLRGVARISWKLIDAIADDQVTADVPFQAPIRNGGVVGQVRGPVDLTIVPRQLEGSESDSADGSARFLVRAKGEPAGSFSASSGRLRIGGTISVPFQAQREVSFDGRYFRAGEAGVEASVQTRLTSVRTRRNGPFGRLVARLVTPAVQRQQGPSEQDAVPVARRYVAQYMDRYTQQFVEQLNEITPVEQSLFKLYPEMRDWRIRLSAEGPYLEARYAPPGSPPVELPKEPHPDAAIEIWIRSTAPEAKFLERLGNWEQARQLLQRYLPEEQSEAGALTAETSVQAFGPWFALLIGRLPAEREP